jgi:alpha-tubulin suppressor-like RCC1 family protein
MSWGENHYGQLGDGTNINSHVPVAVSGIGGVTGLSANGSHSMALLTNATVVGWGGNVYGQLGDGTHINSDVPVPVSGLSGVVAVAAGAFHSLALRSDATIMAWGENNYGQLGNGTSGKGTGTDVPAAVGGLGSVAGIAAGGEDSLALLSDGTVRTWGSNDFGQLGNGAITNSNVPVAVTGLHDVTAIATGGKSSLALLSNGTVMAWGDNSAGQLGNGTTTNSPVPVPVSGLNGVKAISAGATFSLALLGNGTVVGWGSNSYGQLGDGTSMNSHVPLPVSGLSGVTAISCGYAFGVALTSGGRVMAWGRNALGQLGDGTTADSDIPIEVDGLRKVAGVAADNNHALSYGEPLPTVTELSPNGGPPGGGTVVTVSGTDLSEATGVRFGASNAVRFTVNSATSITAVSPPGTGTVAITVQTPASTSIAGPIGHFFYRERHPPEFGRCLKLPGELEGAYKTYNGGFAASGCLTESETHTGLYEWYPGLSRNQLEIRGGVVTLETIGKLKVSCKGEAGTGEISGPNALANVVVRFMGCGMLGHNCTTPGRGEGELQTSRLEGVLGWKSEVTKQAALDLRPPETQLFMGFECGSGEQITVKGSVLVPLATDRMLATTSLRYKAVGGRQQPERFEGGAIDVLVSAVDEGAAEQSGLTVTGSQTAEEAVEVNAVV